MVLSVRRGSVCDALRERPTLLPARQGERNAALQCSRTTQATPTNRIGSILECAAMAGKNSARRSRMISVHPAPAQDGKDDRLQTGSGNCNARHCERQTPSGFEHAWPPEDSRTRRKNQSPRPKEQPHTIRGVVLAVREHPLPLVALSSRSVRAWNGEEAGRARQHRRGRFFPSVRLESVAWLGDGRRDPRAQHGSP